MTVEIADVLSAALVAVIGNGLLSAYLLQRLKAQQDTARETIRSGLEADIRRLQTSLDRGAHVHRAQFEVEFDATRKVWAAVAEARREIAALRPEPTLVDRDETNPQQYSAFVQRATSFHEARKELVRTFDDVSPFLDPAVAAAADEVRITVVAEGRSVLLAEPKVFTSAWYERGEKNRERLFVQTEHLSGLIRGRLSRLVLVEGMKA